MSHRQNPRGAQRGGQRTGHRAERVADMLRAELSTILREEVRDPRVKLATVSHVRVSGDFSHAVIGVSVLGDDEAERQETIATLERAKGFLRSQLAKRIQLRTVPDLIFKLDRGAEHSQRMSDLLESLHGDERS